MEAEMYERTLLNKVGTVYWKHVENDWNSTKYKFERKKCPGISKKAYKQLQCVHKNCGKNANLKV
jgi:hypothetical protein